MSDEMRKEITINQLNAEIQKIAELKGYLKDEGYYIQSDSLDHTLFLLGKAKELLSPSPWILVSQNPDETDYYEVTVLAPHYDKPFREIAYFKVGEGWKTSFIIAWKPKSEPYTPEPKS